MWSQVRWGEENGLAAFHVRWGETTACGTALEVPGEDSCRHTESLARAGCDESGHDARESRAKEAPEKPCKEPATEQRTGQRSAVFAEKRVARAPVLDS